MPISFGDDVNHRHDVYVRAHLMRGDFAKSVGVKKKVILVMQVFKKQE